MMGALQPKGASKDDVLRELSGFTNNDVNWRSGKVLTGLYDYGDDLHSLSSEAYMRFLAQNALHFNMYPSIGKIEKGVVSSVADILRADDNVVGTMTSGGTESILMAVKTARDWARDNFPRISSPEMVLPVTAHPAFHKAAHYFGLSVVQVPIEPAGFRADPAAFKKALGPNTILAAGSAPNFSHGSIDPIAEMADAAKERNILFHVDGCVGGIYLSIMRRMGEPVRDFDFSIPGVTSISVDLHKYGYAPKNASVILYRNRELSKYAWFVCSSTTLYPVINPTIQSTRTGGPVAAAWATLRFLGEEGFRKIVRESQDATHRIMAGIGEIEGLNILGEPDMCMFAIASDEVNIFEIEVQMRLRGWQVTEQFSGYGSPANLHINITRANLPHTKMFLKDLKEVVKLLKIKGSELDLPEITRTVKAVADKPIEEVLATLMPLIGFSGLDLPENTAPLNTVLDLLPSNLRDELLRTYLNMIT
jgi:sphinganine-1-phosphate aldolase